VNIDGSTPKFESLSFMHPDFGADIANMLFPRNHPIKIRGFGFYYTEMHWEVPLIQQSFHRTKKGAYKAMRAFLTKEVEDHYNRYKTERRRWSDKKNRPSDKKQGRWRSPFDHSKWAILPTLLEINE
jgi:hypothetical protein